MDEYQVLSFMFYQLWKIWVRQTITFERLIVVITVEKNVYENSYRITKPGETHIAGGLQELEWASRDELRAEW